jgi:hypothetical protein
MMRHGMRRRCKPRVAEVRRTLERHDFRGSPTMPPFALTISLVGRHRWWVSPALSSFFLTAGLAHGLPGWGLKRQTMHGALTRGGELVEDDVLRMPSAFLL